MRTPLLVLLTLLLLVPRTWSQDDQPGLQASPAQDLFELAQLAYQEALDAQDHKDKSANFETALRQFTRFLQHHAEHPHALKAWYYSAICYDKLGQKQESLRCLRTVVTRWKTGPLVAAAALQVANDSYAHEKYADAAAQFLLAATQTAHPPTRHLALYQRALCFQKLKKPAETISALKAVLADELTTYHQQARKALAHYYRNDGRKKEAYTLYQTLAKSEDPETKADALLQSALLARDLGKATETVQHFEEILATPKLKKWHSEALLFLMAGAAQEKNHARVIALFEDSQAPPNKAQQAKRLLLAIQAYEQSGHSKSTTPLYEELKRVAPNEQTGFEASYIVLSRLYPQDQKHKFVTQAESFLKRYAKSHAADRRFDNVRLMLAETEYSRGHFAVAAKQYAAIDLANLDSSNHPEVRFRLTSALRKAGDEKGASTALSDFLKHHPKDPRAANALAQQGDAAQARKDFPAALKDYDHLLALTKVPKLIEYAWSQKAEVFRSQRDFPALIQAHQFLLETFPERSKTATAASWFWIGWAQFRREEYTQSLTALDTARTLDPDSFGKEAGVHLALARYSLEQLPELQQEVDRLHKTNPEVTLPKSLYAWLGVGIAATGNPTDAWRYLPAAVNWKSPVETKTPVWLAYARAAFATEHYKESLPAFNTLLAREQDPFRQADYHYHLAEASFHLGDHARSQAEAERALKLKPQGGLNGKIRFLLGELARVQKAPAEALQHYVVVIELYSEDQPTLHAALSAAIKILEENGDPDDLAQAQRYRKLLITH